MRLVVTCLAIARSLALRVYDVTVDAYDAHKQRSGFSGVFRYEAAP